MDEEQCYGHTTKPPTKKRQKQYHHKVHTGCVTCRQRRIRCDEGRPTCLRCQRAERQCVYQPRQVKLFERRGEGQIVFVADAATAPKVYVPIPAKYGTPNDVRSLDFYLRRTSPMLSMGSPAKELWTVIIPQASWRYPAIKDMLVAVSMLDQYLAGSLPVLKVEAEYRSALQCYNKSIKSISSVEKPTRTCIVLVAMLAWMFEGIVNQPENAAIHAKAMEGMILETNTTQASLTVEDRYLMTYVKDMVSSGHYIHGQGERRLGRPTNFMKDLNDARHRLYQLSDGLTAISPASETSLASAWQDLDDWRSDFEFYRYSGSESLKEKRSVFMAHNTMATYTSLLNFEVYKKDRAEEQYTINYILRDIEYVMEHEDLADLAWILKVILQRIANRVQADEYLNDRAQRLLSRLNQEGFGATEVQY